MIELRVNGRGHRLDVEPSRTLLSVLRDELDLMGTKYGCGEGQCGACTVLIDGKPTLSCLVRVGDVESDDIVTIEGLASGGELHPVQQAFLDLDAMQCGYCTPGMILAAVALLEANPSPDDAEIVAALDGHICRCGVYQRIVAAVHRAADLISEGGDV